MAMTFVNPANGYKERVTYPFLWALLFGPIYFVVKGIWRHALIGAILFIPALGVSWILYAVYAKSIIRADYLRRGWRQV